MTTVLTRPLGTVLTISQVQAAQAALRQPVLDAVRLTGLVPVQAMIEQVAREQQADRDLIVSAMWTLTETGEIVYGTDGILRLSLDSRHRPDSSSA